MDQAERVGRYLKFIEEVEASDGVDYRGGGRPSYEFVFINDWLKETTKKISYSERGRLVKAYKQEVSRAWTKPNQPPLKFSDFVKQDKESRNKPGRPISIYSQKRQDRILQLHGEGQSRREIVATIKREYPEESNPSQAVARAMSADNKIRLGKAESFTAEGAQVAPSTSD